MKPCDHCGGDTALRNPSGYCDHLYYPDGCQVCQSRIIEYVSMLRDTTMTDFYCLNVRCPRGYDDLPPLNLSRYFWLMSGESQRLFEANILAFSKN